MRADLRREMTGVRGEIAEVSRFLAKHLKIDPSKLGGDPVKLADAADRVTGARKQTAEEFLGKSRTLDKGMAALERQMKAADRNAQSGGEGPDKKKPESKRKRALRFAGRKAAAAMNESIATAMAVAGHLHQATSSMIH
jgi:hypothetical protein